MKTNKPTKMGERPQQIPHQRRYTDGKQAYEKIYHILSLGNANQHSNELPQHTYENCQNPEH